MMLLSSLGLAFGLNMWRLALTRLREGRWWLAQHMNGAMFNFIATHDSFLALGIGSRGAGASSALPRMLIAAGVITMGLILRVAASRRFSVGWRRRLLSHSPGTASRTWHHPIIPG